MKKQKLWACAGLVLSMLGAVPVRANDITYTIQGTVIGIGVEIGDTSASGIGVGDTFTLQVVGDPDSPSIVSSELTTYPVQSGSITFSGGYMGTFEHSQASLMLRDTSSVDAFHLTVSGGEFPDVNGNPFLYLQLAFAGASGTVPITKTLPTNINLSDWSSKLLRLRWESSARDFTLLMGEVTAVSVSVGSTDTDNDGLTDDRELEIGTNPNVADTDGDGLLDGTEVDLAAGGACPDPLNPDSDGDGLMDGAEVSAGTDPCNPDTDGDGVQDGTDPTPLDPGVPGEYLEEWLKSLADEILGLDLSSIQAANNNAAQGRRNSLANRARNAATALEDGNYLLALDLLESLLVRVDGNPVPEDWVSEPESSALREEIELLIALIMLSSP